MDSMRNGVSTASSSMLEETCKRWTKALETASQHETWGQLEEAIEAYQHLEWAATEVYEDNPLGLERNSKDSVGKFAFALRTRIQDLQKGPRKAGAADLQAIRSFLSSLHVPGDGSEDHDKEDEEEEMLFHVVHASGKEQGLALQESRIFHTCSKDSLGALSLRLESWGVKNPSMFSMPRVTVSVVDGYGHVVERDETSHACVDAQCLRIDKVVQLETPLDRFQKGHAIFFELVHYKEKKRRDSVKGYCFMDMEDIKQGTFLLETYKKPTDFKRKRPPRMLDAKAHFLQLSVVIGNHKPNKKQ